MKTLKYFSAFRNLENELYKINIFSNAAVNSAATELQAVDVMAASTPLRITYSKDDIFSSMFTSTATLTVIGSDYMQSIFSATPTEHYVEILKNGRLYWQGYVTQNVYNQDFTNETFEFEIELVDSLAVLKSIPFKHNSNELSFKDYIVNAIKAIPETTINRIYVHDVLAINGETKKVMDVLSVHTSNFKDEENKPNSQYEVLEAIAKYLNMTFYLKEDALYLYAPESNGTDFYYYDIADNYDAANDIVIPFAQNINLNSDAYTGSDNTLSITESYNSISVTNSLYEVDNIYPEFDTDGARLIKETETVYGDKRTKRRYYDSPKFDTWKYKTAILGGLYATTEVSDNPEQDLGAYMVKITDFAHSDAPNGLNWDTVLNIRMSKNERLPLGSKLMNKKVNVESFAKQGFYAALNFQVRCATNDCFDNSKISTLGHSDTVGAIIVPVQIKCGNYYYTGQGFNWWVKEPTTLYLKCGNLGKSTEMTDTWFSVEDTNTWQYMTPDLNGYLINFLNNTLNGELDIIFYTPYLWCNSKNHGYNKPITEPYHRNDETRFFFIKDIDVDFQIPNDANYAGDKTDKDRVFEDVITDAFTGSDYEIELLLSTNQNDSVNRSSVIYSSDVVGETFFEGFAYNGRKVIAEELIIIKHKVQLSKPRKRLEINIKYNDLFNRYYDKFTNATYVPVAFDYNVRYGTTNINLIELHE
ncbi:MAG: hypothetical protein ACRCTZ_01175, partial [Sarcina sp.]